LFNIGPEEIILILVLALIVFGPKRLPEIGRTLGKGMSEFRKASNDLKRTINAELALDEDEQTRHPRRMDAGPVASIVQALSPAQAAPLAPEPPASPDVWRPQEPPAGTVAQVSPGSPVSPIITPAPPGPAPHAADPYEPAAPAPAAPIEPS
jgi:sec-independent protein translocase protein TatA